MHECALAIEPVLAVDDEPLEAQEAGNRPFDNPVPAAWSRCSLATAAVWITAAWATTALSQAPATAAPDSVIALVGGTVIDGNGGVPLPQATIVIVGDRISDIGPSATTAVPKEAWRIDVRGKYLTPGLIDANVHISTSFVPSQDPRDLVQKFLRRGVTTVRDTHGDLSSLLLAKKALQDGSVIGARLLVAGTILGFRKGASATELADGGIFREMAHDTLQANNADSFRTLTRNYLDKGVDFIKINVTDHDTISEIRQPLVFSRSALEAMIQEAHRRGKLVDSHINTPEGLQMAVLAGVDVVQHPEDFRDFRDSVGDVYDSMPDDLARLVAARHVICSIFPAPQWGGEHREQTQANARSLIRYGCPIAVATDWFDPAETLHAIEALVDTLGMTPTQALTAATRTGALAAAGPGRDYGTLEVGQRADVLVLGADPLADIHNIEKLEIVIRDAHVIDQNGYALDRTGEKRCMMRAGC